MHCVQTKPGHNALKSHRVGLICYYYYKARLVDAAETRVYSKVPICTTEKERFPLTAKHLLTPINSYSYTLTARENALGFFCSTAI